MAGAERRKVARDAANVINADTPRGDVPVANDEQFAPAISQGAEIRDSRELYDTVSFDTTKHGQGARITDELIDTAMVDIIERQIEYVGAAVENAVNREWLDTIVDDAGGNFTAESGSRGVPALNGAYGVVDAEDFTPDVYVTHPEFRTTLFDDSNIAFANRARPLRTFQRKDFIARFFFGVRYAVTGVCLSFNTPYTDVEATWLKQTHAFRVQPKREIRYCFR